MAETTERPKFLPSFFSALAERAEKKTLWRLIAALLITAGIGLAVALLMPDKFWIRRGGSIAATVFSVVLTLNGIIMALSWNAFSRIYESISAPAFGAFLRRHNLLNKYVVTVSYIHRWQLLAITVTAFALFFLFLEPGDFWNRVFLGAVVFVSVNAIHQASSAVEIMNDLLWQRAIFDEYQKNSKED